MLKIRIYLKNSQNSCDRKMDQIKKKSEFAQQNFK